MSEQKYFCEDCRFWEIASVVNQIGWCRKDPPVTRPNLITETRCDWETRWPETIAADWCGQLELKEEPASPD